MALFTCINWLAFVIAACLSPAYSQTQVSLDRPSSAASATAVTRVVDDDILIIDFNGTNTRIRLSRIDAPELD